MSEAQEVMAEAAKAPEVDNYFSVKDIHVY